MKILKKHKVKIAGLAFVFSFACLSFNSDISNESNDWNTLQKLLKEKNNSSLAVSIARYRYNYGQNSKLSNLQIKWYKELKRSVFDSSYLIQKSVKYNKKPNSKSCYEGEINKKHKSVFLSNLNFVRLISGLRPVNDLDPKLSNNCQKAAWCLTLNDNITHYIPKKYKCYSIGAALAASKSNLSYGYGPGKALFGMLRDEEKSNFSVGHRRWLLNPSLTFPGYGLTNKVTVVQVIGQEANFRNVYKDLNEYKKRPITWPVAGIHPTFLSTNRFSFSIAKANFKTARIRIIKNGATIKATKLKNSENYGNATLVFDIAMKPATGDSYKIYIYDVLLSSGIKKNFSYSVKFKNI